MRKFVWCCLAVTVTAAGVVYLATKHVNQHPYAVVSQATLSLCGVQARTADDATPGTEPEVPADPTPTEVPTIPVGATTVPSEVVAYSEVKLPVQIEIGSSVVGEQLTVVGSAPTRSTFTRNFPANVGTAATRSSEPDEHQVPLTMPYAQDGQDCPRLMPYAEEDVTPAVSLPGGSSESSEVPNWSKVFDAVKDLFFDRVEKVTPEKSVVPHPDAHCPSSGQACPVPLPEPKLGDGTMECRPSDRKPTPGPQKPL